MLALYAAEVPTRRLRVAAVVVLTIVVGVVIASVAEKGTTVAGHCRHRQRAAGRVGASSGCDRARAQPPRHRHRDRPVVAGVLCLYLLVGLFFAFTYGAVQNLGGAPSSPTVTPHVCARALYFSFVTMTTVGYGDFTARTNLGHTLAITEALLGQIYLVTVVAAIVSRLVPRGAQAQ